MNPFQKSQSLLLLLGLMLTVDAHAQFGFTTDNGAVTITGYTGPGGDVIIPDTIDGLPVARIGNWAGYAFANCTRLTSVIIPDAITNIGCGTFAQCNSLASVKLPRRVISIEPAAFSACTKLTSITFPESLKKIGNHAFANSGLTSITIPSSVTDIEDGAFFNCQNLTNVTIRNTISNLASGAFSSCSRLKINVIEVNPELTAMETDLELKTVFAGTSQEKAALVRNLETRKDPRLMKFLAGVLGNCQSNSSIDIYAAGSMLVTMKSSDPAAFAGFLQMLTSKDGYTRTLGAIGLGNIGDSRAVKPLSNALCDDFLSVQRESVLALGKIDTPESSEALWAGRTKSNSPQICQAVDLLLAQRGNTNAEANLIRTLQQRSAVEIFQGTNTNKDSMAKFFLGFAVLLDLMAGPTLNHKLTVAETLGRLGNEQAVEGLLAVLQNTSLDPNIRVGAAQGLGIALDPSSKSNRLPQAVKERVEDVLISVFHERDEQVRKAAVNTLQKIKGRKPIVWPKPLEGAKNSMVELNPTTTLRLNTIRVPQPRI